MESSIFETLRYFRIRLWRSPLLAVWIVTGTILALILDGWQGFGLALANLLLVAVYAVLIRRMTSEPGALVVKRPRAELLLAAGLFGFFLVIQLFHFRVWNVQPWEQWVTAFFQVVGRQVYSAGLPDWVIRDVYLAVSSTMKQTLPTMALFIVLGYGLRNMGLAQPHWCLTALLLGLTVLSGLASGLLLHTPWNRILVFYTAGIFINALPEELFFRGMLLPRLERVLGSPVQALVLQALFFNALHVPIEIYHGAEPVAAVLGVFSLAYPSGLLWGYLYLRTRSVLPGMFWHAANGVLGFILMGV